MILFKKAIVGFEIFAGVVGLLNWQKIKNSYWKYFPFYLFTLATFTFICYSYWLPKKVANSFSMYVIIPFEFLFIFWLFYQSIKNKKIVIIGVIAYILMFFVEFYLIENSQRYYFTSLSYSSGNVILLVLIITYLLNLSNSEKILKFYREQMFWVALGTFIFYLGTFPYYGLFNLMLKKYYNLLVNYTWVQIFLDYTMYLLFAASFIWGKKEK